MVFSMDNIFNSLPDMSRTTPSPNHVRWLQGLKVAQQRIPVDFAVWVLTAMPPAAALKSLGLMDQDPQYKASLHGYIKGCLDSQRDKANSLNLALDYVELHSRVMSYVDNNKGRCNEYVTPFWKSCAVGKLLGIVESGVRLSELQQEDDDINTIYLALRDLDPDLSYKVQSPLVNQLPQNDIDAFNPFVYMDCNFGPGPWDYQAPGGAFRQPQSPYMAGGLSDFTPSPSPQPSNPPSPWPQQAHVNIAPSSPSGSFMSLRSTYTDGSAFGYSSVGSPVPQQSQFLNHDSGFSPFIGTPQSPANSFLSPQSPNNTPSPFNQRARSLSPPSNGLSNLQMTPSAFHRSPSPAPSTVTAYTPLRSPPPNSPVPNFHQNFGNPPASGSDLSPMSALFAGHHYNVDKYSINNYSHAAHEAQPGPGAQSPARSIVSPSNTIPNMSAVSASVPDNPYRRSPGLDFSTAAGMDVSSPGGTDMSGTLSPDGADGGSRFWGGGGTPAALDEGWHGDLSEEHAERYLVQNGAVKRVPRYS